MLTKMFNLSNIKILYMDESEDDYRFLVETTISPLSHCFKCGTVSNLYKHGKKKQLFSICQYTQNMSVFMSIANDINVGNANETFFENLSDMDVNLSVTNRLISWIQKSVLKKRLPVLRKR